MGNKSILLSVKPSWVEKIIRGEKVSELRKTAPRNNLPCKVYIYCTKDLRYKVVNRRLEQLNGTVCAEFTLKNINEYEVELWDNKTYESLGEVYYDEETGERLVDIVASEEEIDAAPVMKNSRLKVRDLRKYLGKGLLTFYEWQIEDLVVYDKPKKLDCFISNRAKSYEDWLYGIYSGRRGSRSNYNSYLNIFRLKKAPQNWCYTEEV